MFIQISVISYLVIFKDSKKQKTPPPLQGNKAVPPDLIYFGYQSL